MEQAKIYKPEDYFKLTGILRPRYALTAGLTNHMITKVMKQALSLYSFGEDFLPEWIKHEQELLITGRRWRRFIFRRMMNGCWRREKGWCLTSSFIYISTA